MFQTKMTITHSILIQSRRAIRQILRLEKTDQMVKFLGYENNFKMDEIAPALFSQKLKNKSSHTIFHFQTMALIL